MADQKVLICQVKAFFWLIFLLLSFFPCLAVCTILWIFSGPKEAKSNPNIKKKTVLVTGAPLTKALHIARVMGQAGHRVIVADRDPVFMMSMTRFSRYVDRFIMIWPTANYQDELVKIWKQENVDYFLPVSHINLALEDTKAKVKMSQEASMSGRDFSDLAINDPAIAELLDNKVSFLKKCQELNLSVPAFASFDNDLVTELRSLQKTGLFENRHFFLKPLELQREERMDMTPIPSDSKEFEIYVQQHLLKKDLSVPYVLNEFIKGQEYAANVICKNGKIYTLQVCHSSPIQTNYVSIEHQGIQEWVEKFVQETKLSGFVCFDFLVNEKDEVYCIECNPRLHSAIVSFANSSKMTDLSESLNSALNDDKDAKLLKLKNDTEVYWLFQEVEKLLTNKTSLKEFIFMLRHRQDAVWRTDDPLPFLALNFIQMPVLLTNAIVRGTIWNKVNFCLGQVL